MEGVRGAWGGQERWQRLHELAATRIHAGMTGDPAQSEESWGREGAVWRGPEEMLESFEKVMKEVTGCAACRVFVCPRARLPSPAEPVAPDEGSEKLSTVSRELMGPLIVRVDAVGIAGPCSVSVLALRRVQRWLCPGSRPGSASASASASVLHLLNFVVTALVTR